MIRVFPNRLEGQPIETHKTSGVMTLRKWLSINAPNLPLENPPITVFINGIHSGIDDRFAEADIVDVHIEPRGSLGAWAIVIAVVATVATYYAMSNLRSTKGQRQAKGLDAIGLDANTARLGEPIPENFGRPARIYPDYILPPRTYYASERVKVIESLFCVGIGEYQKTSSSVYVGDTKATSISEDVSFQFIEPGGSLTGISAADWWHTPKEVGITSYAGSGLDLGSAGQRTRIINQDVLSIDGKTITSTEKFPSDWTTGVFVGVQVPILCSVIAPDTIATSHGLNHFTPSVGDILAIRSGGAFSGNFEVIAYTAESGGSAAITGTASYISASDVPARLDFGTTPASLTIAHSVFTYVVVLETNYATATELAAAISSQLNSTTVYATLNGSGKVEIIERPQYKGVAITASGSAYTDVFGATPSLFTGDPYVHAITASMRTIQLAGAEFPIGEYYISIGPEDFSYVITSAPDDYSRVIDSTELTDFIGWPATLNVTVFLARESYEMGWTGPFSVVPTGKLANAIEIDYIFPNGLMARHSDGRIKSASCEIYLDWREIGETTWNSETYYHYNSTPDSLGYTQRIDLPSEMSVEVRIRRSPPWKNETVQDEILWTGLRGRVVGAPTSYDGATLLAVTMKTGDRVSIQAENKIWLKDITRKLPTVEDHETTAATRDIMPAVLYMLESVGYGRDRVNMAAATEIHDILSARGDTWDYSVRDASTIKTLANHALMAGFSELVIDRGLIKPVRDAIRDQPEYIYSPQEFTDYPTMSTSMVSPDEADGVDCDYVDESTGRTETIEYRLPGDKGNRAKKISLIGVTNRTKAWRIAARHRRTMAYRRTMFTGETELQALNSSYMSYDCIQDGIPGYGQSAFIVSVDGLELTLSEPMDFGSDINRVIAFRKMDGKVTEPIWCTKGSDDYKVILSEAMPIPVHLGGDNRDPTICYFGNMQNWSYKVLVTAIKPGANNRVSIEAVEYDNRVYEDDDKEPSDIGINTSYAYSTDSITSKKYETDNLTSGSYETDSLTSEAYVPEELTSNSYSAEELTSEQYLSEELTSDDYSTYEITSLEYSTDTLTSTLYPIEFDDAIGVAALESSARRYVELYEVPFDSFSTEAIEPAVSIISAIRYLDYEDAAAESITVDSIAPKVELISGTRYLTYNNSNIEEIAVSAIAPSVQLIWTADYLTYNNGDIEEIAVSAIAPSVMRSIA